MVTVRIEMHFVAFCCPPREFPSPKMKLQLKISRGIVKLNDILGRSQSVVVLCKNHYHVHMFVIQRLVYVSRTDIIIDIIIIIVVVV